MSTTTIHSIALNSFVIDTALSGRTSKEIETNAAELAPIMAASGGWDESQPGQFFVRGNEKHLRAGFTRREAAIKNGWENGYFVEVADDAMGNLLAPIRTNGGKAISAFSQGQIYIKLRDGGDASTAKEGDVVLAPMEIKEIAKTVGKSFVWISAAIGIAESTPEIGDLILHDKISAGVAIKAKQLVKDDKKRLQMLEDAITEAEIEGKPRASESHLDKVKHKYLPKPKAVEEPKPVKMENGSTITPVETNSAPMESKSEPITNPVIPASEPASNDLPLTAPEPVVPTNKLLPKFRKCIEQFSNIETPEIEINDGQILRLSQALIAVLADTESPF